MSYFKIIVSCLLVMMLCSAAMAHDFQQSIHGIKWGSTAAENAGLSKVHEANRAVYYAKPNTRYQISDQPVAGVFYGFYNDKFFAAFVKMHTPAQFAELKKAFDTQYGAAKSSFNTQTKQQVYRWKDGDVKIKLKKIEATGQFKLAFYYTPLSQKLNEERLENIPPEIYKLSASQEGESTKSVPLLDN
ncbi:MAG: hypothetical protein PVF29_02105 [Desulfobacterales bacterium]|jgi:hypothetical protein